MQATLHHVQQENESIQTFYFQPEAMMRCVAGQFIELTLPHASPDERGIRRWFTLSSAPGHELVSITTRRAKQSSSFKQALFSLKPGDALEISEPMGDFVLPINPQTPLVFIAGGIGITPFHSIIQSLLDKKEERSIQFLYSVKTEGDQIFNQVFQQPFIEKHLFAGQPRLSAQQIVDVVKGIEGKQLFISGPEPMTEAIVDEFKSQFEMTQDQLITDYFPGYPA